MSKKWVKLAEATEVAADHLDNGNINAAVAQAEAQTRLADNSDRIAVALERIAEPIDANIEAQENVIIALGLNPSDFKTDLMEHVINGVIGAMTQRLAELEEALDEARGGMEIHRAISAAANRRVAELEAALDAERAAWQWRPVTEDWPHYHDRVVIAHWGGTWAQFARRVQSDDGEDEWLLDDGRKFDFESASVALLTSPPPLPH